MANRVQLIGSGGVGKTSLARQFISHGYKLFPSVTRDWYAMNEVESEADLKSRSKSFKREFQFGLLDYYKNQYVKFQEKGIGDTIAERSLFDNLAYLIMHCAEDLSLAELNRLIEDSVVWTAKRKIVTHLVFLPYPQPWMESTDISDGFRLVQHGKNYVVGSIMYQLMYGEMRDFHKVRRMTLQRGHNCPQRSFEIIQEWIGNNPAPL